MLNDGSDVIDLSNVWKSYGTTTVLKDVNLTVKEGEFIAVRGKSGIGKTTLLKIIGLLEPPDAGEVRLLGKPTQTLSDDDQSRLRLRHIGFVFQFFNLIPSLTIAENIELPLALAGTPKHVRHERTQELLHYFDLTGFTNRHPETLSGGERQRIAVMRALANRPTILLADEPASSLDDENAELLVNLFSQIHRDQKVTIVLTTTDLYEKLPTSSNYLLKDGGLQETRV